MDLGSPFSFALILTVSAICEFVDSSLGMGFGTALTPVLLLAGFSAADVVPVILLSESLTGILSAFCHYREKNFIIHGEEGRKTAISLLILCLCAVLGIILAFCLIINVPKFYLNLLIGFIIFAMGLLILIKGSKGFSFSRSRLIIIGVVAAFNKGLSGGGYGPLVTGGQIVAGIQGRTAVAVTSISEAVTCILGFSIYIYISGNLRPDLVVPVLIGGVLAAPMSAKFVKKIDHKALKKIIALVTIILGSLTITKALMG